MSFCFRLLMYVSFQRQTSPESSCYHGYLQSIYVKRYKYFEDLNRVSKVTCQFE